MANPNFNRDRAAKILLDAAMVGDRAAAEKWKIAVETICRYRKRLETDAELSKALKLKKAEQDKAWADEIPAAIASCIEFIKNAAYACNPAEPEAVHAIAGALKILSEVSLTREVIEARLSAQEMN